MSNIYEFNGNNITLDVIIKIEHIVNLIVAKNGSDFDTEYENFAKSHTYLALQNTNSRLWAESAEYIFDKYWEELNAN